MKIHTISCPVVAEVSTVDVFTRDDVLHTKPIGHCFYTEKSILEFMLDNGYYRLYIAWAGDLESWWLDPLDGGSVYKT